MIDWLIDWTLTWGCGLRMKCWSVSEQDLWWQADDHSTRSQTDRQTPPPYTTRSRDNDNDVTWSRAADHASMSASSSNDWSPNNVDTNKWWWHRKVKPGISFGLRFEGKGMGRGVLRFSPADYRVWGSRERRKLPYRGPWRSPGRKRVLVLLELERTFCSSSDEFDTSDLFFRTHLVTVTFK